jgi:pimeloyl-ACP methyl ester carboxylesterase
VANLLKPLECQPGHERVPATAQSVAGTAQARAHVYLLRGLMNIFSLGMDSLAEELSKRGVYATVSNHSEWQSLADQAASNYKAGKEDPIILIGHSLGADAVMQMAAYLNRKNIPVALVVPFDGTESYSTPANVGRLVNLTQRKYAHMRPGPGVHDSLANVDVSGDPSIDHISIDKSPRLHARAISEVLAVIKGHRVAGPNGAANPQPVTREETVVKVAPDGGDFARPVGVPAPSVKPSDGATNSASSVAPLGESAPSLRNPQDARRPKRSLQQNCPTESLRPTRTTRRKPDRSLAGQSETVSGKFGGYRTAIHRMLHRDSQSTRIQYRAGTYISSGTGPQRRAACS